MLASLTPTDVIATCSLVVAVLALFATSWQSWLAYQHNRLSVRPHLVWHISRRNYADASGIGYSIKNLGLGPAVVRDRYFTKDGVRFSPPDLKTDEVPAFVAHALGERVQYKVQTFGLPGKDASIPANGEVVVVELLFPGANANQLKIIEEMAGDVAFHAKYESMYGEKFELRAT